MLRFIKLSDTGFLPLLPISIHLMLRFIGIFTVCFPIPDAISIHLMLRFISFDPAVKSCLNYFNTSHVTVYHFMDIKDFTVMLEFQYISCYGLSNIRCCKRMPKQNFNTSHVTVYPNIVQPTTPSIEHFNTSHVTVYHRSFCYWFSSSHHFNTSHVTVYPKVQSNAKCVSYNFNTSHVTVYLCNLHKNVPCCRISIHLMLRFISFNRLH